MSDPIADMICRIKNAQAVQKSEASILASKVNLAIAKVLKSEGYISGFCTEDEGSRKFIIVSLKYYKGKPVIENIRRISKPGLRIYKKISKLPKVMGGLGVAIVSTSKGIMTDRAARAIGEGGEVLCYVS